jgi:uncharacterized protein YcbK (DUF882 family)
MLTAFGTQGLQTAVANGDTRTISLHHLHTGEDITITFKREGRYDTSALKKLNWFLRDWRNDKTIEMDPHLFDLVWEAYRAVDGKQPIQIVSAYRSPETNSMLRRRSSGVAKASQHTHGHAMDFFIPGVPLENLRNVGLRLQRGGVGFYPTSGSPFVHLDTGSVRHWPRLSHDQLVKIFPDGRTVHVGTDGRPLKNYALALADIERRGGRPSSVSLAAAGMSGEEAAEMDNNGRVTARGSGGNLLARLFGGGKETAETAPAARVPASPSARPGPMPTTVATTRIAAAESSPEIPLPQARPIVLASAVPAAESTSTPPPMPRPAPGRLTRPDTREPAIAAGHPLAGGAFQTASADPAVTASIVADQHTISAMAYAPAESAPAAPPAATRAAAMGKRLSDRQPDRQAPAALTAAPAEASLASLPAELRASISAQRFQEPWLRAVLLAPSVSGALTALPIGPIDRRHLAVAMHKPRAALPATFSVDPHHGIRADRFTGHAVVFLATASFGSSRTASLIGR